MFKLEYLVYSLTQKIINCLMYLDALHVLVTWSSSYLFGNILVLYKSDLQHPVKINYFLEKSIDYCFNG
jgi:hypothetical protein